MTGGLRSGSLVRVGLHQIISIDHSGAVTQHWQLNDLAVATRMAERLAEKLGALEVVKIRREFDVVNTFVVDLDIAPPACVAKKNVRDCHQLEE